MSFTPSENPITNPTRETYTELRPFRFWCQKVLPLVYDDSLSYYELLCKVVDYLNKTMEDVDHMNTDMDTLYTNFQSFQEGTFRIYNELVTYVNNYFDNLDVQDEIDHKLDEMVTSGTLFQIFQPFVSNEVADWLSKHITPTTPSIDDSLSVTGAGADAKKVGDDFSIQYSSSQSYYVNDICLYNGSLYKCIIDANREAFDPEKWAIISVGTELSTFDNIINGTLIGNNLIGYFDNTMTFHSNANWRSLLLPIEIASFKGTITTLKSTLTPYGDSISSIAFFDENKNLLVGSRYNQPVNTTFGFTDIPNGTKYVVFNTSNVAGFMIKIDSLNNRINTNTDAIAKINTKKVTLNGLYNGNFYFVPVLIHKGDTVIIKAVYNGGLPNIWFSNGRRNSANIEAELINTSDYNYNYITANACWSGFTAWSSSESGQKSWTFEITIISTKNEYRDKIIVSANDSKLDDVINSDLQCTGENDQNIINKAIVIAQTLNIETVVLCDGNYNIDGYNDYNISGSIRKVCICVHNASGKQGITLRGDNDGKPHTCKLNINANIYSNLSNSETLNIICGGSPNTGYAGGNGFSVKNIEIILPNSEHKVIAINNQWSYWGDIKNCFISCTGYGQDVLPVEGCIGIRGWSGWTDGIDISISDVAVLGFYVGFQLGGEHLTLERCVSRFNYYGYTFGEYQLEPNSGAQVHPITLINCADEHIQKLPKFSKSGNANNMGGGLCTVSFINFNIEYYPLLSNTDIEGAVEEIDGGWCGIIDYSIENNEQNNRVDVPFWKDNNGVHFRTINTAHKQTGTSNERRAYAPNYMQMFFDTTLNKVLFCKTPSSKTWIDASGNVVE